MPFNMIIAEDEEDIALFHKVMAEKNGNFRISTIATTISEAKESLSVLKPDIILLDVYFPDGNGIDLIKWIRSENIDTDVLLITAAKESASVEKALKLGIFDYLIKPFMIERFQRSLDAYINYKSELSDGGNLSQHKIDNLMKINNIASPEVIRNEQYNNLPKGIDKMTLDKIQQTLETLDDFATASEIGEKAGLNRTTARRYLEFLVSRHTVTVDVTYGTVGRPEKRYKRHI